MDAGRDWHVLAPRVLTSPASQQPVVGTQSDVFNRNCLVEFRPWSPPPVAFRCHLGFGIHIPADDLSFLPGADYNFYLLDLHGDLDLRAQNSLHDISTSNRFDFL